MYNRVFFAYLAAPTPAPELQPVDIVLSGAPSDKQLADVLTGKSNSNQL